MSNFERLIIALPNQKKKEKKKKNTQTNQSSRCYISDSKLPGEARMTQGPTSSK